MKKSLFIAFVIMGIAIASYGSNYKVAADKYRNWHHVKSMVIFDEKHPLYNLFGGIHHVYVNNKGLETIKKKGQRQFPDGTEIAIVFYEHKFVEGAYVEGPKKLEAFMVKDSKTYNLSNGWGYFGYDASGKNIVSDMVKDCHSCHADAKTADFVFSTWTE